MSKPIPAMADGHRAAAAGGQLQGGRAILPRQATLRWGQPSGPWHGAEFQAAGSPRWRWFLAQPKWQMQVTANLWNARKAVPSEAGPAPISDEIIGTMLDA